MNERNKVELPDLIPAATPKKPYTSPHLTLFGHVAALTQSTGCSSASDSTTTCTPGGMGGAMISDRRVKTNIVRIGDHPAGFGIYLFRYVGAYTAEFGEGRRFGVLADEVEAVVPGAVSAGADGIKRVRYDLLGIRPCLH